MPDRLHDRPWFTAIIALGGASVLTAAGVLLAIGALGVAAYFAVQLLLFVMFGHGDGDARAQYALEQRVAALVDVVEKDARRFGVDDLVGDMVADNGAKVSVEMLSDVDDEQAGRVATVRVTAVLAERRRVGFGDRSWSEGSAEGCFRITRDGSEDVDCESVG